MLTTLTAKLEMLLNQGSYLFRMTALGTRIKGIETDLTANIVSTGTNTTNLTTNESVGLITADWAAAAADKTIAAGSVPIQQCVFVTCANASGAANLILPVATKKILVVKNTSGQAITVKQTGGTGIAVANAKTAILMGTATDFVRVTADA
jgi:hypothetical protein